MKDRVITLSIIAAAVIALLGSFGYILLSRNDFEFPMSVPSIRLTPIAAAAATGFFAGLLGAFLVYILELRRGFRLINHRLNELERRVDAADRALRRKPVTPESPPQARAEWPKSPVDECDWHSDSYSRAATTPERPREVDKPTEPPPAPRINEAVDAYNRLLGGSSLSRSSFEEFFASLGGRRDLGDGRRFLAAVETGRTVLVFPSYEFASNMETQFSTIASIPDELAEAFDVQRGEGEILLEYPAVFDLASGTDRLVTKGTLRGFRG
ncbi:MAG TPA: hypothetical protein VGF77_09200 [Allosphingosinicella sp.]|jgi:hypothetical protein